MPDKNQLILLADHIHNLLSVIVVKYKNGIDLSPEEEEVLCDLNTADMRKCFDHINDIEYKEQNKFKIRKHRYVLNY